MKLTILKHKFINDDRFYVLRNVGFDETLQIIQINVENCLSADRKDIMRSLARIEAEILFCLTHKGKKKDNASPSANRFKFFISTTELH